MIKDKVDYYISLISKMNDLNNQKITSITRNKLRLFLNTLDNKYITRKNVNAEIILSINNINVVTIKEKNKLIIINYNLLWDYIMNLHKKLEW